MTAEMRDSTRAQGLQRRRVMKRSTGLTVLAFVLGVICLGGAACSEGNTMTFGNDASGGKVSAVAGDTLVVTLDSIGNQGDPSVSSPAIRFDTSSLVGVPNPGGPTMRYTFTAVGKGAATITIPFLNPSNPPPFTLDVTVD